MGRLSRVQTSLCRPPLRLGLEERIFSSNLIARVKFRSATTTGMAVYERVRHPTEMIRPTGRYKPGLELTFDALEYLKGTGASTITALAPETDGRRYDTVAEAKARAGYLIDFRDKRWDDREAIVFMDKSERGVYLNAIGYSRSDGELQFSIASRWGAPVAAGRHTPRNPRQLRRIGRSTGAMPARADHQRPRCPTPAGPPRDASPRRAPPRPAPAQRPERIAPGLYTTRLLDARLFTAASTT